jgi:hypothetical protein
MLTEPRQVTARCSLARVCHRLSFDTPAYTGKEVPEDLLLLILPKWIEATQKRTLEHTRRPIIAANIARFGEDEIVITRREGG